MLWNETKATTENLSILDENMQVNTKAAFFERWVRTCNERDLHFRGLVSERFLASQKRWYDAHNNEQLAHWHSRYVTPAQLPITHNTVIYDDVVAHYQWSDNEIFGIEIHNQDIADAQRGLFELAWKQAKT
jgi:hypothetical protein